MPIPPRPATPRIRWSANVDPAESSGTTGSQSPRASTLGPMPSGDEFDRFGLGDEDRAAGAASGEADGAQWLLDRVARRPTGTRAREVYGADDVHDFARRAILAALALGPEDRLLEIGCGGVRVRGGAAGGGGRGRGPPGGGPRPRGGGGPPPPPRGRARAARPRRRAAVR